MTTEEYGISTVYSSTAAIVIIFTSLQLPYGSLSTAMIKYKDDRYGYLSSLCMISTALTALYLIICIIFGSKLEASLGIPVFLLFVLGFETLFTTANTAWMGQQRFEYKYKNVVVVTLGVSIISVVVSLLLVMNSSHKGIVKVLSNALVMILVGLVIYIYVLIKGKKPFKKEYWKFALSFNIPLIPYYLSQVIFNQSDRLMINRFCGTSAAAIYGVAYSLATILIFVVNSIHSSYIPWLFERIDKNDICGNGKMATILSSGIALMLLGIIALAPEIIRIMAGEQYIEAIWAVPPVAMSVLLLYYADLFDCLLFFYEKKVFLTVAALVSAILNIVLNGIFIPVYGFITAAYTTLVSYMVLATMDYFYMLKICKEYKISKHIYNIKSLVAVFLIFVFLSFFSMVLYNHPVIRYTIVILVLAVMFIFRKRLIQLSKLVFHK